MPARHRPPSGSARRSRKGTGRGSSPRSPSCSDSRTSRSVIATGTLVVAVVLQIVALFRSLRIEDNDEAEYRKTVRWFIASAVVLLVGLLAAVVAFSA